MHPLSASPTDDDPSDADSTPPATPQPPHPADEMALGYEAALPYLREDEADRPAR